MTITTRKRALGGLALLGASALVLAGCAAAPEETPEETEALDFTPCIVSDAGGWDDKSFNEAALDGMEEAAAELGVEYVAVESADENAYEPNVQQLVDQGCDLIVTVGFLLAEATTNQQAQKTSEAAVDVRSAQLALAQLTTATANVDRLAADLAEGIPRSLAIPGLEPGAHAQ